MINLILIDDHQVLIDGMTSLLSEYPEINVLGSGNSGKDLHELLKFKKPDIILLDINMPGDDGVDICGALKKSHPEIKVIALTMLNEASYINGMIKAGAKGYLLKNTGADQLLKALETVYNGGKWYDERLGDTLLNQLNGNTENKNQITRLTQREKQVVICISQGLTAPEIAKKLFISLTTVETHRKNVLSKLGAKNSAEMVQIVLTQKLI